MAKKNVTDEETVEKISGPKPFEPRRYVCSNWPFLSLGRKIKFKAGFFTAETQEQVDWIEKSEGFGRSIIHIKDRKKVKPSIEEATELAALEELKKLEPQARRGMIGTRTGI